MRKETHYEVLGVPKDANIAQIRHMYRRLIFQYHPDRNRAKDAHEIFVQVNEAFEVLSDPQARKRYDASLGVIPAVDPAPKRPANNIQSEHRPKPEPEPDRSPPTIRNTRVELTRLRTLLSRGKLGEAEQMARILTREAPDEALPYAVLGDMARNRGQMQRAAEFYALAVQKEPRNLHFQNLYETAVKSSRGGKMTASSQPQEPSIASVVFAFALTSCCGFYVALDKELPLIREPKVLSTWTLGVIIMLFLSGLAMGAGLAVGGHLEPISGVLNKNTRIRTPIPVILGLISLVNFWIATLGYAIIAGLRGSLNNSTAKLVAGVAAATLAVGCGSSLNERLDTLQILLWGGNIAYFGGLLGWISAERLA